MAEPIPSRRKPRRRDAFCWARIPQVGGGVTYRLFRRDLRRAVHAELLPFHPDCTRQLIAKTLRAARHRLRNTVDDIDLHLMGVTQ